TFAEMTPEVKHAHSHRGRSSQKMLAMVRECWL
ncbi:MAG: non-canonical purine NTP pyrophosphatase, partial [Comamonas sp.]